MNRKHVPLRLSSLSRLLSITFLTILLIVSSSPVIASPTELPDVIDFCYGVDHPPFIYAYEGDGYSYLNVGLTVPLQYHEVGDQFTGELSSGGNMVTAGCALSPEGQLFFVFPLYSYGDYTATIYDAGGDMIFQNDMSVDASEVDCDPAELAESPPKVDTTTETDDGSETSTSEIDTTETDTTETDSTGTDTFDTDTSDTDTTETEVTDTATTSEEEQDTSGLGFGPVIIIGLGLIAVLIGIKKLLKKNCEKERQAWLAASAEADAARNKAREAEEAAEKLTEKREGLEEELDDIRETYPSAGKPDGEEAWIEIDGRRITSRDIAMRREADKAAWDKYRSDPNPDSAQELQEDWREAATPKSEEERKELDEKAKALEEAIKKAKEAEDEAVKKAKEAQAAEKKAEAKAEAARKAYEACIKAALTPPKPEGGSTPGTSGGSTDGGSEPPTEEEEDKAVCNDNDSPQERNRVNLGRVTIPVDLKVTIDGGDAHESAELAGEISGELADVSEKLGWISKLMDLKGIGETIMRDGAGWSLVGAAAPPAAGVALDVPVPTSPGQLAVDTLSILGKISSVIIGKVPELQERRLPDCDVSASIKTKVFTVECVEIWVCRDGQWVKDHSRFSVKYISNSSRNFQKRRALTWAQSQQLIRRYEQRYQALLRSELDKLARLEAGCK